MNSWVFGIAVRKDASDHVVSVRDVPEVVTSGDDLAEALELALDAIEVSIGARIVEGEPLPASSPVLDGEHAVALSARMAVKASVYEAWPAAGISKTELARRMGRSEGEGEMDRDDVAVTALFQRLGLAPDRVEHPPVHTVEEARPHWSALAGAHTKNLFLKDKDALFLVTLGAETRVDMKALAPLLGTKRLSFASADRLMQHLGTAPGAVSPLSLVKDEARAVRFAIERALWEAPRVTCHPLRNTATVSLTAAALRAILADLGVEPILLDL